jgi:hypothetical protein
LFTDVFVNKTLISTINYIHYIIHISVKKLSEPKRKAESVNENKDKDSEHKKKQKIDTPVLTLIKANSDKSLNLIDKNYQEPDDSEEVRLVKLYCPTFNTSKKKVKVSEYELMNDGGEELVQTGEYYRYDYESYNIVLNEKQVQYITRYVVYEEIYDNPGTYDSKHIVQTGVIITYKNKSDGYEHFYSEEDGSSIREQSDYKPCTRKIDSMEDLKQNGNLELIGFTDKNEIICIDYTKGNKTNHDYNIPEHPIIDNIDSQWGFVKYIFDNKIPNMMYMSIYQ